MLRFAASDTVTINTVIDKDAILRSADVNINKLRDWSERETEPEPRPTRVIVVLIRLYALDLDLVLVHHQRSIRSLLAARCETKRKRLTTHTTYLYGRLITIRAHSFLPSDRRVKLEPTNTRYRVYLQTNLQSYPPLMPINATVELPVVAYARDSIFTVLLIALPILFNSPTSHNRRSSHDHGNYAFLTSTNDSTHSPTARTIMLHWVPSTRHFACWSLTAKSHTEERYCSKDDSQTFATSDHTESRLKEIAIHLSRSVMRVCDSVLQNCCNQLTVFCFFF